jgi:hypothetical protein
MTKQLRFTIVLVASAVGSLCAWSRANAASTECSTAPGYQWLIVPKKCIGAVPWAGSEADFSRAFGTRNVKAAVLDEVINAEGVSAPGIVLFPNDSLKSVNIVWADPVHRRGVGFCYLQYSGHNRPSRTGYWHLASGISLGMSIRILERMNHRPFTIRLTNIDVRQGVENWQRGGLAAEGAFIGLSTDEGDLHIDRNFQETKLAWSSDKDVRAANLWIDYIAP